MTQSPKIVHVMQGEFAVSADPDVAMQTILGSCVATCLFDREAGVGGMNHFLLPDGGSGNGDGRLFGINLMELLINNLMRAGASKTRLEAKLFGGASMFGTFADVGTRNAAFARKFLADEGIPCIGESLGGGEGRRLRFWPVGGRALQNLVANEAVEIAPPPPPKPAPAADDIELF